MLRISTHICNELKDSKVIIKKLDLCEKEMFLIQSGTDLDYILSETYGFEFYITNKQCSYLLCFNHHNIL